MSAPEGGMVRVPFKKAPFKHGATFLSGDVKV